LVQFSVFLILLKKSIIVETEIVAEIVVIETGTVVVLKTGVVVDIIKISEKKL